MNTTCLDCNINLTSENTHTARNRPTGLQPRCKICDNARKVRTRRIKYAFQNDEHRNSVMQARRCSICLNEGVALVVDYNTATGTARGALCRGCNAALTRFEDTTVSRQMWEYLSEWGGCVLMDIRGHTYALSVPRQYYSDIWKTTQRFPPKYSPNKS